MTRRRLLLRKSGLTEEQKSADHGTMVGQLGVRAGYMHVSAEKTVNYARKHAIQSQDDAQ